MKRLLALLLLLPALAQAAPVYLGDFRVGDTVRCPWNTFSTVGVSATRATNGTVSWRENGATGESQTGVTDTEDLDSKTGEHLATIAATTANGFDAGNQYIVDVAGAVVDGQTINAALCVFNMQAEATRALAQGVAQAGSSTTIQLASATSIADDKLNYMLVCVYGGTGPDQCRLITDWVSSTDTATVNSAWQVNPASGSEYVVLPANQAALAFSATTGRIEANVKEFDDDATGSPLAEAFFEGSPVAQTGNVYPLVDTEVAAILDDTGTSGVAIADNSITAAKIAADAIGASELATDAITSAELAANAANEVRDALNATVITTGITQVCKEALDLAWTIGPWTNSGTDNLVTTYYDPVTLAVRLVFQRTADENSLTLIAFTCP